MDPVAAAAAAPPTTATSFTAVTRQQVLRVSEAHDALRAAHEALNLAATRALQDKEQSVSADLEAASAVLGLGAADAPHSPEAPSLAVQREDFASISCHAGRTITNQERRRVLGQRRYR